MSYLESLKNSEVSIHFVSNNPLENQEHPLDLEILEGSIANVRTKQDLLGVISSAMYFPDYFGKNWDALFDCMKDMAWLPAKGYVLVLHGASQGWATSDSAEVLGIFVSIWLSAAKFRKKYDVAFHLIFVLSEHSAEDASDDENHHSTVESAYLESSKNSEVSVHFALTNPLENQEHPLDLEILEGSIANVRTEQDLFGVISSAMYFPDYFGKNWAALFDCMTDMAWLPAKGYVLVLHGASQGWAKSDSAEVLGIFVSFWLDAAKFRKKYDVAFHLIFVLSEYSAEDANADDHNTVE